MLLPGLYRAENNDGIFDHYKIDMYVKETPKSYIFTLEDFESRYAATQIERLFSKSKRVVIRKTRCGHALRIWSDRDFTFYPFQAGVPYLFRKIEVTTQRS